MSSESGAVSSHKVVETTVVQTTKTVGGDSVSGSKATVEELKTVEEIITSCMETTTSATTSTTVATVAGM